MTLSDSSSHVRIAIVGAGFGGIGMAARLAQAGERDFVILEKSEGVGGTWWVNRYPGCACDVPSHLYSFSFAPNPNWGRRFAPRHEIQTYLERCVDQFRLRDHLRLNYSVHNMRWDESEQQWLITNQHGQQLTADIVVSAIGGLSRPAWPDIPGLEQFSGRLLHSQLWDESEDLQGQRVAVIGTGASAVQLVPEIADQVQHLCVYQRTPNWILPRPDRVIGARAQMRYRRLPWLQKLIRFSIWFNAELRVPGLLWSRKLAWGHKRLAQWHLRRQIGDRELQQKLMPDYDIGCKRVLLSSNYYPTLMQTNVELIDTPIARIEERAGNHAIVDQKGGRRPVDTLILATGFQATEPVPTGMIVGRGGLDLNQVWGSGPQAYRGICVAGFPNLFLLLGPNTALGHNSVILMIEAQIKYILNALRHLQQHRLQTIEIRPEPQQQYNKKLQRRLRDSVWNDGGCGSWYLHPESGLNTTLWPGFTWQYRQMMKRFDADNYRLESR